MLCISLALVQPSMRAVAFLLTYRLLLGDPALRSSVMTWSHLPAHRPQSGFDLIQ